jgi:hypothetical protein
MFVKIKNAFANMTNLRHIRFVSVAPSDAAKSAQVVNYSTHTYINFTDQK